MVLSGSDLYPARMTCFTKCRVGYAIEVSSAQLLVGSIRNSIASAQKMNGRAQALRCQHELRMTSHDSEVVYGQIVPGVLPITFHVANLHPGGQQL